MLGETLHMFRYYIHVHKTDVSTSEDIHKYNKDARTRIYTKEKGKRDNHGTDSRMHIERDADLYAHIVAPRVCVAVEFERGCGLQVMCVLEAVRAESHCRAVQQIRSR